MLLTRLRKKEYCILMDLMKIITKDFLFKNFLICIDIINEVFLDKFSQKICHKNFLNILITK